ncbi:hypothetical protein B1A75_02595 [Geobacillus sp. LEMMY01]|nr:hypothetical protein B1A75_02595 [Geobacillus sp. LEMMY01]
MLYQAELHPEMDGETFPIIQEKQDKINGEFCVESEKDAVERLAASLLLTSLLFCFLFSCSFERIFLCLSASAFATENSPLIIRQSMQDIPLNTSVDYPKLDIRLP